METANTIILAPRIASMTPSVEARRSESTQSRLDAQHEEGNGVRNSDKLHDEGGPCRLDVVDYMINAMVVG